MLRVSAEEEEFSATGDVSLGPDKWQCEWRPRSVAQFLHEKQNGEDLVTTHVNGD